MIANLILSEDPTPFHKSFNTDVIVATFGKMQVRFRPSIPRFEGVPVAISVRRFRQLPADCSIFYPHRTQFREITKVLRFRRGKTWQVGYQLCVLLHHPNVYITIAQVIKGLSLSLGGGIKECRSWEPSKLPGRLTYRP